MSGELRDMRQSIDYEGSHSDFCAAAPDVHVFLVASPPHVYLEWVTLEREEKLGKDMSLHVRTTVGLDNEVLSNRLEKLWAVGHGPVDAPEGLLGRQTAHEAADGTAQLLVEAGHRIMDPLHVHADLFADGPALREAHHARHKPQLAIHLSHQAQVLLCIANACDLHHLGT